MSRFFQAMVATLAIIAAFGSKSEAGLVRVAMDDFSLASASGTYTIDGYQITRTATGTAAFGDFGNFFTLMSGDTLTLQYTVTAPSTFADLYDDGKSNPNAIFDGFEVLFALGSGGGSFDVDATGNAVQTFAGANGVRAAVFRSGFTAATNTVTFNFTSTGRNGSVGSSGSLSAVPEPSALLLVGSVLGMGFLRRRRS